jgi:amidase
MRRMGLSCKPASELRRLIATRELSCVELIEASLARIERHDGTINAVVTRNEHAVDEARRLDERLAAGEQVGVLAGLPVGIKDVTPVAGLRTTYGSPLYAEHVPEVDALVVQRLRAADAIVLGKTNAPEFATGGNTFNEVFGATRNPWNPELSAGGSTGGGAAALAAGMIALAEGTDLGGSLRIPASFCGVVGLRPSPGLVPTWPHEFLWDDMQVTGGMARTAEDVALLLQATAGPSRIAPLGQPVEGRDFVGVVQLGMKPGTRIAYCDDVAGIGINDNIRRVCREAAGELEQAGATVEQIDLDLSYGWDAFLALRGLWMVVTQFSRRDRLDELGPNLAANVRAGLQMSTERLAAAQHARARLWAQMHDLLTAHDFLLTPCMAVPPFPVEQNYPTSIAGREMKTHIDWVAPTFILSLSGLPIVSVPAGLDDAGLPVGIQVVGPPRGEEAALAVAAEIQKARPIGLPEPGQ